MIAFRVRRSEAAGCDNAVRPSLRVNRRVAIKTRPFFERACSIESKIVEPCGHAYIARVAAHMNEASGREHPRQTLEYENVVRRFFADPLAPWPGIPGQDQQHREAKQVIRILQRRERFLVSQGEFVASAYISAIAVQRLL